MVRKRSNTARRRVKTTVADCDPGDIVESLVGTVMVTGRGPAGGCWVRLANRRTHETVGAPMWWPGTTKVLEVYRHAQEEYGVATSSGGCRADNGDEADPLKKER